jgi:predicted CoA-substrate-specific enzyme activase
MKYSTETNRYFVGLDIGASYTKCVAVDDHEKIVRSAVTQTGFDFTENARKVFDEVSRGLDGKVAQVCSTGYGRKNVEFAGLNRTEIACQSRGCFKEFGMEASIVDIGGQDVKIIRIDENGKRVNFKMNRKCAAGTGAFIEEIAFKIRIPVNQLEEIAQSATGEITLGSFCTVFTATEILSHIREQTPLPNIVRGIYRSVAKRISEMDYFSDKVIFTGGLAKKGSVLSKMIAEETGSEVSVPEHPQITCAYGAALYAKETNLSPSKSEPEPHLQRPTGSSLET